MIPKIKLEDPLLCQPNTKNYSRVGTAFDYMLRFYMTTINTKVVSKPWIAEIAVKLTKNDRTLFRETSKILSRCKEEYARYQKTKKIDKGILEASLLLAQLDPIYRTGYVDPNLGKVDGQDVADLSSLMKIVNPETFKAKKICLLNPDFGAASHLVRGADADLVIDNTLIDIKTTKYLRMDNKLINQLMGYYILYKIGKLEGYPKTSKIDNLGIYFSRHGKLITFKVAELTKGVDIEKFIFWFIKEASKTFSVEIIEE